ncbi:hypothetical protein M3Y95_00743100 [Aphelenchoides besseyi]|nr:hypothetical protein M3Y95_00743100 [Aphelenchoides besseyi]
MSSKEVSKNGKNSTTKDKSQKPKKWNGVARKRPDPYFPAIVLWSMQNPIGDIVGESLADQERRWVAEFAKADQKYWKEREEEEKKKYERAMAEYNRS